jgi:hypothetical protein
MCFDEDRCSAILNISVKIQLDNTETEDVVSTYEKPYKRTLNQRVVGSSPTASTKEIKVHVRELLRFVGFRFNERKLVGLPTIGSRGVPDDGGVAPFDGAFRGVPRHPAVGHAIKQDHARFVAAGLGREAGAEIVRCFLGKRAISDVRQPNASRNVLSNLVPPNCSGWQFVRFGRVWHDIEEYGPPMLPQRGRLLRRHHLRALQCLWHGRFIVFHPVAGGFGYGKSRGQWQRGDQKTRCEQHH